MSFAERLRSAVNIGKKTRAIAQVHEMNRFWRKQRELHSQLEESQRRREEKFNRLNGIVLPVLDRVGLATWGQGNYRAYPHFSIDNIDTTQWNLTWTLEEKHEPESGFWKYRVELDGRSLKIWYNSPTALRTPISKEELESGFLVVAATRGPARSSDCYSEFRVYLG